MSVTVIAEIGSCHDGSLDKAKRLIDVSIEAGADLVKAQYWSSADALADRRKAESYRAVYQRYAMPRSWLFELAAYCGQKIGFACTAYLADDCATIAPYVSWLKLASFEFGDQALLMAAVETGKPLIVSTGMTTLADVRTMQETLEYLGTDYRLLHCTSAYPAPLDALQLEVLTAKGIGGWLFDGLSDHSGDVRVGGWAVAKGADMIEAHVKLEETDRANPDAPHAFHPAQFAEYVRHIRDAEKALGTGAKILQPAERAMSAYKVA